MDSCSSESDMNDSSQTSSSESDGIYSDVGEGGGTRKCRRHVKRSNYLQGKCRKVYKLNESNMSVLFNAFNFIKFSESLSRKF